MDVGQSGNSEIRRWGPLSCLLTRQWLFRVRRSQTTLLTLHCELSSHRNSASSEERKMFVKVVNSNPAIVKCEKRSLESRKTNENDKTLPLFFFLLQEATAYVGLSSNFCFSRHWTFHRFASRLIKATVFINTRISNDIVAPFFQFTFTRVNCIYVSLTFTEQFRSRLAITREHYVTHTSILNIDINHRQ